MGQVVLDTLEKNKLNKNIFRAYDIRGKIGTEWCLDNNFQEVFLIGQAIGLQLIERQSATIIIGRDGRLSSEAIADELINGLLSVGCDVTNLGLTATPVVYHALTHLGIQNSIMITGSHSPPDHNGIKIVYASKPLSSDQITQVYQDIIDKLPASLSSTNKGKLTHYHQSIEDYQQAINDNIQLNRKLSIGIDSGNGATALFSESLFKRLGCDVIPLFCTLDGTFPNHSPDPTSPKNLKSLIQLVKDNNLDIGIAFDGDGDRVIAVDNLGNILWPDRILMLLAQEVLRKNPGATVLYDVKCSFLVPKVVEKAGGKASMCISGHSILKAEMLAENALLGGEFSGHIILRDRWSNFDDGPYVAARLLEILSNTTLSCHALFSQFPVSYATPECKIEFESPQQANEALKQFIEVADFGAENTSLIDGLRVDYDDGWGLIRSSNTSASLTFRFDATSLQRMKEILQKFRGIFKMTAFKHKLPY